MPSPRAVAPTAALAVACLFASTAPSTAMAGGVGLMLHGGAHGERAYYYSDHTVDGAEITERSAYDQYVANQMIPQFGGGLEFLLGDRDDAVQGVFRLYYNMDTPQSDPSGRSSHRPSAADAELVTGIEDEWVITSHREEARHTGMASMGLNWVVFGRNNDFKAGLSAHLGSGFLTTDHTEFFNLQVGPTINYRIGKQVTAFADLHWTARFRKEFGMGTQAVAGARLMFD